MLPPKQDQYGIHVTGIFNFERIFTYFPVADKIYTINLIFRFELITFFCADNIG